MWILECLHNSGILLVCDLLGLSAEVQKASVESSVFFLITDDLIERLQSRFSVLKLLLFPDDLVLWATYTKLTASE